MITRNTQKGECIPVVEIQEVGEVKSNLITNQLICLWALFLGFIEECFDILIAGMELKCSFIDSPKSMRTFLMFETAAIMMAI